MSRQLIVLMCWMLTAMISLPALADKSKFDMNARLYTKWLYRNDDTQGVLWLGNPFWPDDIQGNNGVATEFELEFIGNVSKYVKAGGKIQSRFGGMWHDWWESGERKWEYLGEHNTSGDSLGMNRAQYMKFRGFYVNINPPIPYVDWFKIGASDLRMFNAWSIGKIRYIDRDNARGVFLLGGLDSGLLSYHAGIIALPKLWVGPNWSTGIGDDRLEYPFITQDWAYGVRLDSEVTDWFRLSLVGTYTRDVEFDKWDPDARGSLTAGCLDAMGAPIPGCTSDHAVSTYPRYQNGVVTVEAELQPGDVFYAHAFAAYSRAETGERFTANGVKDNDGFFPVIYGDVDDFAYRGRLFLTDPLGIGVSLKLEGFFIGEDWTSVFGARREDDVLLTDGFLEGGQLPTLNLANEFIDFDEPWFESCVGWAGGTAILGYQSDAFEVSLEGTFLTYDTNRQNRDVDEKYPDFLHTDGYTDTDLYDYANLYDRGRDPRSVYHRDQDRQTMISMLKAAYTFDFGLRLEAKGKYIRDDDWRKLRREGETKLFVDDDYLGNILVGRLQVSAPLFSSLTIGAGYQHDYWDEVNRSGDISRGYGDYLTKKHKGFAFLAWRWGGVSLNYLIEYIYKFQDRPAELLLNDQEWKVWRSKASMEVAW